MQQSVLMSTSWDGRVAGGGCPCVQLSQLWSGAVQTTPVVVRIVLCVVLPAAVGSKRQEHLLESCLIQTVVGDEILHLWVFNPSKQLCQRRTFDDLQRNLRVCMCQCYNVHSGIFRCQVSFQAGPVCQALDLGSQVEALAKLVLQMPGRPDAHESAADHDGETVAQGLALLHRMRRQHNGRPHLDRSEHGIPQLPAGPRIHSARGLIQKHDLGAAHQGNPGAELALVATAIRHRGLVGVLFQHQERDETLHLAGDCGSRHSAQCRKHGKNLTARENVNQSVVLWTVTDVLPHGVHVGGDIMSF
eukprot:m.1419081 g.1419081  ORF g.1419081 m.1419081 type:complete len:303 (+) comp25039_c0_seq9:176-1084(+)